VSIIKEVEGRQILDSRGVATVEVKIRTDDGLLATDSVPSGTSAGKNEAVPVKPELAVNNINHLIAPKIIGQDSQNQEKIDQLMLALDGTTNESRLGANAILAVSLASARVAALASKMPLFWYLNKLFNKIAGTELEPSLPLPMMVGICGGKHAKNNLCIQEFLLIGQMEQGRKVWHQIEKILKKRRVPYSIGLEGAFSPELQYDEDALEIILAAIAEAGLQIGQELRLGLDIAGNNCRLTPAEVLNLFKKYPIYSLEDPFAENEWEKFAQLKIELQETGKDYLLIGDDLFATHKNLLQKGINSLVANGIIIKVNQAGTLTEALAVVALAKKAKYKCIVSHRSGETQDTFIADLAVAVAADFLKSGAPIPRERILKYQRLKEIEGEL